MDLFVCSKCGVNLIEIGIREVIVGGTGETNISFKKNTYIRGNEVEHSREVEYGSVDVHDFDDQWVVCNSCGADLHDRTAIEIIEAYENELPHIRRECDECGGAFAEVECGECKYRSGQCKGIREGKTLCQKCCAEEFRSMILNNPLAFVLSEAL